MNDKAFVGHENRNINREETVLVIISSPPYCRQMYTGGKFRCVCRTLATQTTTHPISQTPIAIYRSAIKDQALQLRCVMEGEHKRLNGLPVAWVKNREDTVRLGRSRETGAHRQLSPL